MAKLSLDSTKSGRRRAVRTRGTVHCTGIGTDLLQIHDLITYAATPPCSKLTPLPPSRNDRPATASGTDSGSWGLNLGQ